MIQNADPIWTGAGEESFSLLVSDVVSEGVERLLVRPTEDARLRIGAFLDAKGLTWQEHEDAVTFHFDLLVEAVHVAGLLGYALALTPQGLGDFETWLRAAITKAGLDGYQVTSAVKYLPAVQP